MRFAKTHEWVGDGDPARLGISAFAQEAGRLSTLNFWAARVTRWALASRFAT